MTIAEKLREARNGKNWSQEKLSGLMGYFSQGYISDVERGKKKPPRDYLEKMLSVTQDKALAEHLIFELLKTLAKYLNISKILEPEERLRYAV